MTSSMAVTHPDHFWELAREYFRAVEQDDGSDEHYGYRQSLGVTFHRATIYEYDRIIGDLRDHRQQWEKDRATARAASASTASDDGFIRGHDRAIYLVQGGKV